MSGAIQVVWLGTAADGAEVTVVAEVQHPSKR